MPTIGVADILITPVFKDLQRKVGKELDGVGEAEGKKAGNGFGKALATAGVVAAGVAATGIGLALTKGFGRLQAIENARAKLTGLGHDVKSVEGIMQNAMAAVKGTAFGLDEAAAVAAGAVAAGIKPGLELEKTLRLTGDAATIAGVGMGEMGAIFNKVASSNKIQGDVIAQLNDAGIPIVQLLGKELGTTAEETLKLASDGKVNFETFQKAMEAGLGGAALESGKTLQGAFKNTMAAVGRIGANLLTGVYPKIQQFFSGAIEWLKPLEEGAKVAGAAIGTFLERAITGGQGLYDLLVKGDFTGKLNSAFGWEEDAPLVKFLWNVHAGAQGIYDLLVKGDYNGILSRAFGIEEDSRLVGFLFDVREAILKIPAALVGVVTGAANVAKFLWDMRVPITVIAGLIVTLLIPHWIALGVEALKSAAKQALAWSITRSSATKAAFVHSGAVTAMVAGWVVLGAKALGMAALWGIAYALVAADSIKAALIHAGSVAAMVGGWVLMGAQAMLNAARIAGAWLIALGPVGWAIGIIAGLVGAFVAAYNNIGWFRDGVDAAFRWVADSVMGALSGIRDAAGSVANWFRDTAVPIWEGAVGLVGDIFEAFGAFVKSVVDGVVSVFESIYLALKPAIDSTMIVLNGFGLFFRGIGQLVASIVTYILVPLFMTFWNRVVESFNGVVAAGQSWWASMVEVFNAVAATITGWWNFAAGVFNAVVSFLQNVFGVAFVWLRDLVGSVFAAVGVIAAVWWANLQRNFNAVVSFVRTVLAVAFTWFRDSIITPVFNAISAAISWAWNSVLRPTFDAIVHVLRNVIAPAFTWLHQNVIKPAFDGIGSAIKWVWDNVIKPVFDTLHNAITKTIPDAFKTGVDAVKKTWNQIQEIAKTPVRFVIEKVINEGLIGAFNNIAGMLPGIDKLPQVAVPGWLKAAPGFAEGGYTGDGGKYQPAGIVHAGEFVFTKEQTRRAGVSNLYAMANALAGYAKGGLVHPLRASTVSQPFHGGHNGIDFAAPTGTPIGAAGPGRVSSAGWSSYGGGNEIHIDHPNGLQTWYAHLSSFAVKLGQMVSAGQMIGKVGSTGNSTGPHLHYMVMNGGWPNFMNPAAYLDGGGEPGKGGWNPISGIIDGLLGKFKEAFPGAGMVADLAIGVGKKLLTNVADFITGKGGKDNLGTTGLPYLHDQGGVLNPGLSSIMNATRKPEAILTAQQWSDIHRLATGNAQRGGVNINGPIHVRDEHEMVRLLRTSEQDAQAVYAF